MLLAGYFERAGYTYSRALFAELSPGKIGWIIELKDSERMDFRCFEFLPAGKEWPQVREEKAARHAARAEQDREAARLRKQKQYRSEGRTPHSESASQTMPWRYWGWKARKSWDRNGQPVPPIGWRWQDDANVSREQYKIRRRDTFWTSR